MYNIEVKYIPKDTLEAEDYIITTPVVGEITNLDVIPLSVCRGDELKGYWKFLDVNGQFITLDSNSKIIVGIKRSVYADSYLIKKVFYNADFVNNGFYFTLTSEETGSFTPSIYIYDIGLQITDNEDISFCHLIRPSPITIRPAITNKVDIVE